MSDKPDVRGLRRAQTARTGTSIPMPPRRWRTRVLLPTLLLAAVAGVLLYSMWDKISPATAVRAVPVIVKSVVGEAPGSTIVQAPGWLEPAPYPRFVSALTDGIVAEVLVLEGDTIEAGQVVARLVADDAELGHARAAATVDAQRGVVAAAQAEVEAARATLDNLVDRKAAVEETRAEIEAVDAERIRLDAQIGSAQAKALATQDELDRKSALVASQAVSRGEVERLRLRLAAERAAHDAVRAAIPVLDARRKVAVARHRAAQQHIELLIGERRALRLAETGLETARAKLREAEAALQEADLRLARIEVRSPVAGVVMERIVSPGSRVLTSSADHSAHVLHVYDPAKLQVRVDVPLADAARVGIGQRAEVVVEALPEVTFAGVVSRLVHLADVAKNTVEVKVAVSEPRAELKPEMLARVRFLASSATNTEATARQRIFAPRRAIRPGADGDRVWVVEGLSDRRGRVASRAVTLGPIELDDHVEVATGLRPGDRVIVDAPGELQPGDAVIVTEETH